MNKSQKSIILLAILGLVALATIPSVSAQTATSTVTSLQALIQQLQEQAKILQVKIDALRKAQSEAQQVGKDIHKTLTLIRELREGMTGDDVKALQGALAADSEIYPEGLITGYYGPLTIKAVKKFQKTRGLEQVGWVGPKTLVKVNQVLGDNPISTEQTESGNSRLCAIIAPGHFIAPGWLRKQGGVMPIVPQCQVLPYGISKKLPALPQPPATTTPPADITAPIITSIAASNIASTTAAIIWTTNESATSKAYYGTSSPINLSLASSVSDNNLVTNHLLNLSSLTASTTYYYIVESKDGSNNTATSSQQSFLTTQ